MRSLPARPAPQVLHRTGRRQINSQDTQTAGSVVSKSQAACRYPTLSQSRASPTVPIEPAIPASSSSAVKATEVYCDPASE